MAKKPTKQQGDAEKPSASDYKVKPHKNAKPGEWRGATCQSTRSTPRSSSAR
jgi:hypothetical protein